MSPDKKANEELLNFIIVSASVIGILSYLFKIVFFYLGNKVLILEFERATIIVGLFVCFMLLARASLVYVWMKENNVR